MTQAQIEHTRHAGRVAGLGQLPAGLAWDSTNLAWKYTGGDPGAAGVIPPGVQPGATGAFGTWVQTQPGFWLWFPSGLLATVTGADGNTYFVYSSRNVGAGLVPASNLPPPTGAPQGAPAGSWVNTFPGYYVWVPSSGMFAGMSTGTMILLGLLGVGVLGTAWYFFASSPATPAAAA